LASIEGGFTSFKQASITLADDKAVQNYIEKIREEASPEVGHATEKLLLSMLAQINANSEKTLNGQDSMRVELKGLIDELHSSVKEVKAATHANTQTSADIRAATLAGEATAKAIASQVTALGTVSGNIHDEVKKAVKNTSTVTAVLVGLGVGFMAGLPTNYIYERNFSVEAMNKKADTVRKDQDKAAASAPPPPNNNKGTPLVSIPYGPFGGDPLTGKSMLDLLNDGQTVRLFKQDGSSICLKMPKPIPCIGAEVPKITPKATSAPPAHRGPKPPHRRVRHHAPGA
jgi:hypothetical protein